MRVRRAPKPEAPPKKKRFYPPRKIGAAAEARIAEKSARVIELKSKGWSRVAIAKELKVDPKQVERWWERAYAEFIADHRKVRDEKFAEILAGHEMMIRDWSEAASKPNSKKGAAAALIVLRARREISKMCGHGTAIAVTHTGAEGGPIVTVNATPMEHARMVREQFRNRGASVVSPVIDGGGSSTSH